VVGSFGDVDDVVHFLEPEVGRLQSPPAKVMLFHWPRRAEITPMRSRSWVTSFGESLLVGAERFFISFFPAE